MDLRITRSIGLYVVLPICGLAAASRIAQATVDTTWIVEGQPVSASKLAAGLKDLDARLAAVESSPGLPAGTIVAYAGDTPPEGWLLCDGHALVRTDESRLFAAIGTGFGSPDATRFNVPDLRGRFVRGADHGAGNDPDAKARTAMLAGGATGDAVGSVQGDALASHSHAVSWACSTGTSSYGAAAQACGVTANQTAATGGSETRPRNVSVNYIIKR